MPPLRAFLLAPALLATRADPRPVDVDKVQSSITFRAAARFAKADGRFDRWDADVALDPAAFEYSAVRLTIDAGSVDTRNARRDAHLRGDDFFDAAKYPTITFASRSVATTSPTAGTITGDLTMHGVTRSVAVPVAVVQYADGRGRFRGAFALARRDYGLSYNTFWNPIADTVRVQFDMSLAERR